MRPEQVSPKPELQSADRPSARQVSAQSIEPAAEQYTRVRQSLYVPPPAGNSKAEMNPVPRTEVVKGYEYEKDRYVVLENEDFRNLAIQTGTEMQILEFVKLDEIDPVYFETSYYVIPDDSGEKPYALLFQAMRESQFVALGEVAMHRREHVMILRPGRRGILAHTMFYGDEIREEQEYRADKGLVGPKELQMAKLLIESLAAPFEPGKYKDKFREKVEAMIAAKLEGRTVAIAPSSRKQAEVVDILHALESSLKLVRKPAASTPDVASQRNSKQRRTAK